MGLGTLWIGNTCFAYKELVSYLDTEATKKVAEHRQVVMEFCIEEFVVEWEGER